MGVKGGEGAEEEGHANLDGGGGAFLVSEVALAKLNLVDFGGRGDEEGERVREGRYMGMGPQRGEGECVRETE